MGKKIAKSGVHLNCMDSPLMLLKLQAKIIFKITWEIYNKRRLAQVKFFFFLLGVHCTVAAATHDFLNSCFILYCVICLAILDVQALSAVSPKSGLQPCPCCLCLPWCVSTFLCLGCSCFPNGFEIFFSSCFLCPFPSPAAGRSRVLRQGKRCQISIFRSAK